MGLVGLEGNSKVSFDGNENDLKLIMVMDWQLCEYTKNNEWYILNK